MPSFKTYSAIAFLFSVVAYRSGGLVKNCILVRSPLPTGYIADGDYATDCTTLRPTVDGPAAADLSSCEDGTLWELHNSKVVEYPVVFGCDAKRLQWNTVMGPLRDPSYRGTLWLYVPTKSQILGSSLAPSKAHPISLVNYPSNHDFHPMGMEISPSHSGNSSHLFVINHARERSYVEQFAIDPAQPTKAVHIRTIASPFLLSPNGLTLTSPNSFYITNDHLISRRVPVVGHFLPIVETLLGLPLGFVTHITLNPPTSPEGVASTTIAKAFVPFPNGVGVSASGQEVAVVSTTTNDISFYERDPATHAFGRRKYSVEVPFSPDNIQYSMMDGKEVVILGGHPNFPDLTAVVENKTGAASGSWVIAIIPKDGNNTKPEANFDLNAPVPLSTKISKDGAEWTIKTLFQSHGKEGLGGFGGSTGGLRDPDTGALYISGLYATDGFMVCKPSSGIGRK